MQPDPYGMQNEQLAMLAASQHGQFQAGNSQEVPATAIIACPKKMVGRVIGKNGETIKALQNFTGAQIQIDQRLDPTRVSIAGPPKALVTANNMVQDIVAGTFKGFAMLRAYAQQGRGVDLMSPQAPVYIKGYGFIPPSQYADPQDPMAAMQLAAQQQPQILANPSNSVFNPFGPPYPGIAVQPQMYGGPQMMADPQYTNLQLALDQQAQLLSLNRSQIGGGIPPAIPQMQPLQNGALGGGNIPTSNPGYIRNQVSSAPYPATRQTFNGDITAQLEAMSLANTTGPLANNGSSLVPTNGAHHLPNTTNATLSSNGAHPVNGSQGSNGATNYL